ncbi:hypothetical protein [Xylophilus sp.]|uniref:hypothetical protein n=1 Tax=Xylophilus sp. TaxID=2653893 RepID=UPI0013B6496E|nr:hypothetical protein [Xylophilus sp.]KAF1044758.1 MAG: hypothetical protein GAK38_03358 [Xylophilus sp.]
MSASLARERLERSRQILLRQLQGPVAHTPAPAQPPRHPAPPAPGPIDRRDAAGTAPHTPVAAPRSRRRRAGFLSTARDVAGLWWPHHPARTALSMVEPALAAYGQRKPFTLLAAAAATGAALVGLRAWRHLPVTGLVAALLRSSQFTSLAASLVAAGAATLTFPENHDENEREALRSQR